MNLSGSVDTSTTSIHLAPNMPATNAQEDAPIPATGYTGKDKTEHVDYFSEARD